MNKYLKTLFAKTILCGTSAVLIAFFFISCAKDIVDVNGSIHGVIKDFNTGALIANCQVSLAPGGKSSVTGSDGVFEFGELEPGTYTVSFSKAGYEEASKTVSVTSGETSSINITLKAKSAFAVSSNKLDFGDLSKVTATREAFKERYAQIYPNDKPGAIPTSAGMLYRFIHEIKIGDYVVFPSKVDRKINIGVVEGDYYYEEDGEYVHRRNVKWLKHLPRTFFSQGALYEVGSALSFFSVKNYADEFLEALAGGTKKMTPPDEADNTIGATAEEIKESTKDFILGSSPCDGIPGRGVSSGW